MVGENMLVVTAAALLATVSLIALVSGLVSVARQYAFAAQAYRVQGQVTNESCFRIYGRNQRYYRVEFQLRNGQHAALRGSGSRPAVGQAVPVLVREREDRDPKARIDAWTERWLPSAVLLFVGTLGSLMTIQMFR